MFMSNKTCWTNDVQLLYQSNDALGEGCIYCPTSKVLFWVDIVGKKLNMMNTVTGEYDSIFLNKLIGCVCLTDLDNVVVVALEDGLYLLNVSDRTTSLLVRRDTFEDIPHNRFNDGKSDMKGRMWIGTMDNLERDGNVLGTLYCFGNDLSITPKQKKSFCF